MAGSMSESGEGGAGGRQGGPAAGRWLVAALLGLLALATATPGLADHESTNALTFAPVEGSSAPGGSGSGEIAFNGGREPESRWTASFRFAGLAPDTAYTVVVRGRFGEEGSAEAEAFSAICAFRSSGEGDGGCWDYELGMRRLGVAQLRLGDEVGVAAGEPVLQATRAEGGPGAIVSTRNAHSPAPTAAGGAATPVADPFALP